MRFNIYNKIWVDCIKKAQSIPANKDTWKFYTMGYMSMAMAINLATIVVILEKVVFKSNFYNLPVDFLPKSKLGSFIGFFILFLLPNLLLNYLLIFRNNRYQILLTKYKTYNGKLFFVYFSASFILPLLLVIIKYTL